MKSTKILITALSLALVMLGGCKKDVFTGIDSSKAGVTDFTFDEDASGKTSIAFYWTDDEAIKAGATSFSVQLAQKADFTDIDMYDASIGKTISATSAKHDAVTFEGLTEGTWYYARVRANYPRSIYSDWTQLMADGAVICISVGHGVVIMDFVAPQNLKATPKKYNKFTADWGTVAPCEGYSPEYKKASESNWTVAEDVVTPTFSVIDAAQGTDYEVRVRGFRTVEGVKEYTDYSEIATVTTPIINEHQLASAADVIDFFNNQAATASNSDIYYLNADVDLGGAEISAADSFIGEFIGNGKTISNAKAENGLFTVLGGLFDNVKFSSVIFGAPACGSINSDGEANKVIFNSSCSFSPADPTGSVQIGILCGKNEGTIKNCATAVKCTIACTTLPDECSFGGLIGSSEGYIENCSSTGGLSITVSAPTSGKFHWVGGVAGQVRGKAGEVIAKNCTNSGEVYVEFKTACYFVVGGVIGGTPSNKGAANNYGIIDGLNNSANVTDHYINGGSGSYPNVGGCVGYVEGYLMNAINSGKVSMINDSPSATWTNVHCGGVAGAVTQGAKDCENHGSFLISLLQAGGTAGNRGSGCIDACCYGGVIGAAGPYNSASKDIVFEGLVNDATINFTPNSITETPNSYFGGVLGYAKASVKNCQNKGAVSVSIPTHINRLGGIVGGCCYDLIGCTNTGAVSMNNTLSVAGNTKWCGYVGGICAWYEGSKSTVSGNNNSGAASLKIKATVSSSRQSGVAGIIAIVYQNDGCTLAEDNVNTGELSGDTPGGELVINQLFGTNVTY